MKLTFSPLLPAAGTTLAGALLLLLHSVVSADGLVVYKSPTCGCCSAWIDHLQENGLEVESHNRNDMVEIKEHYGVPSDLRSCHTAVIEADGIEYLIEGHVPAREIERLLREKPAIRGLAVAGMPLGSPGMEGHRTDHYEVTAFGENGERSVYASY